MKMTLDVETVSPAYIGMQRTPAPWQDVPETWWVEIQEPGLECAESGEDYWVTSPVRRDVTMRLSLCA